MSKVNKIKKITEIVKCCTKTFSTFNSYTHEITVCLIIYIVTTPYNG